MCSVFLTSVKSLGMCLVTIFVVVRSIISIVRPTTTTLTLFHRYHLLLLAFQMLRIYTGGLGLCDPLIFETAAFCWLSRTHTECHPFQQGETLAAADDKTLPGSLSHLYLRFPKLSDALKYSKSTHIDASSK